MEYVYYRESDGVAADSDIDYQQPASTQLSDVILLETEQCLEPLPNLEPCSTGFWGQWFSALKEMYPTSDRKGKQIIATTVGGIGLIAALAAAACLLPANAIGLTVAYGLVPLPVLVVCVWQLIIVSEK